VLDEREALSNLIDALRRAESSARQLALTRDQPQWIKVGALLAEVRSRVVGLAQRAKVDRLLNQ
jgi:hypothetical protein